MQGKENDKNNKDNEDDNNRNEKEDEEEDEEENEEDKENNKDINSSRKSRKRIFKKQSDRTGQQFPLQEVDVQKLTQVSKHHKKLKKYKERLNDISSLQ